MSLLPATLPLQGLISNAVVADVDPSFLMQSWRDVMDQHSSVYCKGIRTYDRMLQQLHLHVCQTSDHNAGEERTLLHRATDSMGIQKVQGDVIADVCIAPFASGDNGRFAGDYPG